uniref:AP2/ERF domain-containing protein n=1 Tax=Oryza brachyantha TaxID=4533 RepID=J3LV10_ORYBR
MSPEGEGSPRLTAGLIHFLESRRAGATNSSAPPPQPQAYDQAAFAMRGTAAVLNFPVEQVRRSMDSLGVSLQDGASPVVALKRRHSMRAGRRPAGRNKRPEEAAAGVMELEDLGAEYLEELLGATTSSHHSI